MPLNTNLYILRYSIAKKGALIAYRQALLNENLSQEMLAELCWDKIKRLLHYAYNKVPYYNQKFRSVGLHPSDIKNQEHYTQVPILTREDIKQNFNLLISSEIEPDKLKISTTGGSTGEPLKIGMNPSGVREVPKWQLMSWWGVEPGTDFASIYRNIPVRFTEKIAANLISWPQKIIKADASRITETEISAFIEKFRKIKPQLVHGYVGAIDTIADYILSRSIQLPAPKVTWLTAAPVSAIQEKKISRAFGAPVCDQYGCSEIYFISAECMQKKGMHIFADSVYVEIINEKNDPVPDGEFGKIILTNLNEFFFPLIRYENGDSARLLKHKCTCGRSLPMMDKVKGRISDNIILPDGSVLSGEYLTTIFDNYTDRVRKFQLIQKNDNSIILNVILSDQNRMADLQLFDSLKLDLNRRIRNQVPLIINKVNYIENYRGKLQYIIKDL